MYEIYEYSHAVTSVAITASLSQQVISHNEKLHAGHSAITTTDLPLTPLRARRRRMGMRTLYYYIQVRFIAGTDAEPVCSHAETCTCK